MAGTTDDSAPPVLILGGGILGVSVAYHLALRGVRSTVVDQAGIASCASGKAGGFLARDWNDRDPGLAALTRKSFDMHEEVAKTLGLTSYRRLKCRHVQVDGSGAKASGAKLKNLEWADLGVRGDDLMGDETTIAQVHPQELTEALWASAESRGATLRIGRAERLGYQESAEGAAGRLVSGAFVDGAFVPAEKVVLCMGPWGSILEPLLNCRMLGIKYHSVLMRTGRTLNEAVFFAGLDDPEVYPRNDGNTYVTGFPDPPCEVEEQPGQVEVRDDVCDRLITTMGKVSSEMKAAEVTLKQACYLPFIGRKLGTPCMGLVPGHTNAYVATGHGCWGILNSLASGLAMSELIVDGVASSVDLSPFDPRQFGD